MSYKQQQQQQHHQQHQNQQPSSREILPPGKFSRKRISRGTLQHVQIVSQRAALAGKRKIWDTNDASISAALSAVDRWESTYSTLRSVFVTSFSSAKTFYNTARSGAERIEHHLLVPVRDLLILPAFGGVERATTSAIQFLHSDEAHRLADTSLALAKRTPFVGENVLAPIMLKSGDVIQRAWDVIKYPIPSRKLVINVTDCVLTSAKWSLLSTGRELYFYLKLVDATVTRTLSHTQWRVLGSGPYNTLDECTKKGVIDHLCERYFSLPDEIARYELTAHVKCQNARLFLDWRDVLLERSAEVLGGEGDEWLKKRMRYRDERFWKLDCAVEPLWFHLRNVNGERPKKDAKWICFPMWEGRKLEKRYWELQGCHDKKHKREEVEVEVQRPTEGLEVHQDHRYAQSSTPFEESNDAKYPTIARWYTPNRTNDIFVDQNRHAVCFHPAQHDNSFHTLHPRHPPLQILMKPTLWRFHGPGDTVCRSIWLLDTVKHGLQPFGDASAVILEDAYLFLKWQLQSNKISEEKMEAVLLTVQVMGPGDGEEPILVQFRSLTKVTAVQKTLGGALAIWKRRVYRGVHNRNDFERRSSSSGEEEDWISEGQDDDGYANRLAVPSFLLPVSIQPPDPLKDSKIDHLILVIHGIGEMLRSIDLFGMNLPPLSSIVDCCSWLRNNHSLTLSTQFPDVSQRVEYIPVEWHEAFAVYSSRSHPFVSNQTNRTTVNDITIPTIPGLRAFANDTLLDVLYFMSPKYHDVMIDIVTREMNHLVERLNWLLDDGFRGKISIMAHSLGSIIAWDILSHQNVRNEEIPSSSSSSPETPFFANFDSFSPPDTQTPLKTTESDDLYPQLTFPVTNTFLLGSPLAIFLLLRNYSLPRTYTLPGCPKLFNIFHPYDPAAYRIEPLLHPQNAFVEPMLIPHWKSGGFRVQYQTKLLWRKFLRETQKQRRNWINQIENRIKEIGLLDSQSFSEDEEEFWNEEDDESRVKVVTGQLNRGGRIDYMLQEKEIENANEYVFALGAHSVYWDEKDLSLFVAKEILSGEDEEEDVRKWVGCDFTDDRRDR